MKILATNGEIYCTLQKRYMNDGEETEIFNRIRIFSQVVRTYERMDGVFISNPKKELSIVGF